METCARCGSGVVYRFNARATPESAYVYVCLGAKHHVHADPATARSGHSMRADDLPTHPAIAPRSRILERRPLRVGGFSASVA